MSKTVLTAGVYTSRILGRPGLCQKALRDDRRSICVVWLSQEPNGLPVLRRAADHLTEAVQHPSPPLV